MSSYVYINECSLLGYNRAELLLIWVTKLLIVVGCCRVAGLCGLIMVSPVNCHQSNNVVIDVIILVTQNNQTNLIHYQDPSQV